MAKLPGLRRNLVLVDSDVIRARTLAGRFDVKGYGNDHREFLDSVDGAIIASPNRTHTHIAKDLLNAGIPVLCEKPLTENLAEARMLASLAADKGVALAVNHTRRLFPSYQRTEEMISRDALGDIYSLSHVEGWRFAWPTVSGFYFNAKPNPRGILLDIGSHVLDVVCWWLGGKPTLLSSENDSFGGAESVAHLKFQHDKCLGEIKLSRLNKLENRFRINGERGSLEGGIEAWGTLTLRSAAGLETRMVLPGKERHFNDFAPAIVRNFVDVVANGAQPLVSAGEVLPSIEWIEECYLSATRLKMPWYDALEMPNAG